MNQFKLNVDRLTEDPEHRDFTVSVEWWSARDGSQRAEACQAETPFLVGLDAVRVRDEIVLEGDLSGQVGLECSRCAKRYSHALRDSFRLVLLPAKGGRSTDQEVVDPEGEQGLAKNGLCLGEDLDAGWYRAPEIRLDDFIGEMIALAMPLQPLCRSECPGICPHCGADLSEKRCDCVDEKIDSPFAVLAKLGGDDD